MGTINYRKNEFVCLGFDCDKYRDDFKMENDEVDAEEFDEFIRQEFNNCKDIISDYRFDNFKIELKPGYYEGFYVNVDTYFDLSVDEGEKSDIRTELSNLKECLCRLATAGNLESCYPGWGTGWAKNLEETLHDITDTVVKMDEEIESIPLIEEDPVKEYPKKGIER